MTQLALYFGSLGDGHFLHGIPRELGPHARSIRPDRDVPGFPWSSRLVDGGLLDNGKIPDHPDGRVWWTAGRELPGDGVWQAFYWWDRSADARPGSNSGFYVRGFALDGRELAFGWALASWPKVVKRQHHPLVLQPWPRPGVP